MKKIDLVGIYYYKHRNLLLQAIEFGYPDVALAVLDKTSPDGTVVVDVNNILWTGETPLFSAIKERQREVVDALLALKKPDGSSVVDTYGVKTVRGETALSAAQKNAEEDKMLYVYWAMVADRIAAAGISQKKDK